ncbi:MAG TPA: 30S ribosomal protein S6 [Peptococcaceae bacterium]|nr:MAG: 30S ribosomal protein S6 [Clostridia bacterium 41_269]HBT19851.1 30S ribosomal protein S6 [Peptococcaceae bacterium]
MRSYETLFIINPELDDEGIKAVIEKYTKLLKDQGAEVISVDEWGRRRLAYEIKKHKEGYYVLINFDAEPQALKELERIFRIDSNILRFIIVNRIEQAKKKAEEAEKAV